MVEDYQGFEHYDRLEEGIFTCKYCKWSDAHVGNSQVCGYALQGGETIQIKNGISKGDCLKYVETKWDRQAQEEYWANQEHPHHVGEDA